MTNPSRTTRVTLGLSLLLLCITIVGAHAEQSEMPDTQPATAGFAEAPIHLDQTQRQMIGLTFGAAERKPVEKVIHTVGRFDYDERKLAEVVLKVSGYIQDVFVDYTGKSVKKGDPLFSIYSPDLVTAQQEYLLARQNLRALGESEVPGARDSAESLLRASRERLRLWDISDAEVAALERSGKPKLAQTIYSPISGVVTEKTALKGHAVEPGMPLYKIADLSTIWVYGDIYEYELPLVHLGQEATITLSYDPSAHFTARVAYISPTLDPKTRTAKVRFELKNSAARVLRPEMYGRVELHASLGERLVVPSTAVLDSGRRQVVFVDGGAGRLVPHEVKVGDRFGDTLEIVDGLQPGERIVTSGNFLVDSESKLQAAESMMGMMGAIGMGDWKMESAKPMDMGGGGATEPAQPPPSTPTATPSAQTPQERRVGDLVIAVSPASEPTTKGESPIQVRLRDANGQPVTGAKVSFSYTMDMPGMRIDQSEAKELGNGLYQGPARFTMGGPWGLVVQIDRSGMPTAREKFTVRVSG
jgi:membrane fusion protein, copper/silver efflux system